MTNLDNIVDHFSHNGCVYEIEEKGDLFVTVKKYPDGDVVVLYYGHSYRGAKKTLRRVMDMS